MGLFQTKSGAHEAEIEESTQSKESNGSNKSTRHTGRLKFEGGVASDTSTTNETAARSIPAQSIDDNISNMEYSADIRPLTFNVKRSSVDRENNSSADSHYRRSLSKVKEKLSRNSGLYNRREASLRTLFGSIDREQFENYLREPHYIKMLKRGKHLKQFRRLFLAQELIINDNEPKEIKAKAPAGNPESAPNAIWVTKFSVDGNYMASGGKDGVLRIWKVIASPLERWHLDFTEENIQALKTKASIMKNQAINGSVSSSPTNTARKESNRMVNETKAGISNLYAPVFHPTPSIVFRHHTGDILDIDWSKNNFLATASMDKTVSLWHPERANPLETFVHPDFVTCVAFHPTDDRFLITGCLDHKCRLWSVLDREVTFEFDCQDLITSIAVSPEDATYTFVGTFNGYVYILATKGLEYVKSFHVTDKETQQEKYTGKAFTQGSKIHHGPRVICLQSYEDVEDGCLRLIVTSNDSRIRVFDVKTKKCLEILKGFQSGSSQTNSQLSIWQKKPIVACGSEDHWVYAWRIRTRGLPSETLEDDSDKPTTGALKTLFSHGKHNDDDSKPSKNHHSHNPLHLKNLFSHTPGGASDHVIKNNYSISFHAHHSPVTTVNVAPPATTKLLSLSNDLICELSLQFYMASDNLDIIGGVDDDVHRPLDSDSDSSSSSTLPISNGLSGSSLNDLLKDSEETAHEQALPSVVDAIGTIMVTTDTAGVIRVFRADLPPEIRKRVLEKLQDYRRTQRKQEKYNSSDSLSTLNQANLHTTTNSTAVGNGSMRNSLGLSEEAPPSSCNPSRRIRASSVFKNSLFNHSSGSLDSSRTNRGSASSAVNEEDTKRKESISSNINGNAGLSRLRCDVCNGTKFATRPGTSSNPRDAANYCLDCGTMLNNFR